MTSTEAPATAGAADRRPRRLVEAGLTVLRQTVADPVTEGRLRDHGWPYGLRACVTLGYVMFGLAALLVLSSGPIRAAGELLIDGTGVGLPVGTVWPLTVLLSFGTAALFTGALHGPWWLKVLGLLFALMITGTWSLRVSLSGSNPGWLVLAVVLVAGLVVLAALRWRRRFAWWELPVSWTLIGAAMSVGLAESRSGLAYGSDLNPLLLQQATAALGYLALPAATIAGAAAADVSVRAAVAGTRAAERLAAPARRSRRRWPYLVLAVLLVARTLQAGWQVAHRDPVTHGLPDLLWAVVVVLLFAVVGFGVLRIGRRHQARPEAAELGDELGRVGFPVAAALIGLSLPVQVGLAAVQIVVSLRPGSAAADVATGLNGVLTRTVDPSRAMLGVLLIGLAVRAARRGRVTRALVLGCTGVMLFALARALLFGDRAPLPLNPDALNLVLSGLVLGAVLVALARRRLDPYRACAYAGLLVLSELITYRDFVSDPVGALLGFSGAALVLFGVTWDLLTGAGWGNADSRRFPRPTRVLLVLTNSVLTMTVLAYAALVRDGSTTIYLDPYAQFGDLIFGTALLAAAVLAVVDGIRSPGP